MVDSVAVSIFLLTDVPVAFDSSDHTHVGVCVPFMLPRLVGGGSAKSSLICTSVQPAGNVVKIKEFRLPLCELRKPTVHMC